MDEIEPRDPITGVPIEQDDPQVYLPGTPTVSFTRYLELAINRLFR
ncbi:hypothetical protein [Natronococcus pandeyae]|nr:hypothetical protein [Natronococcus pandeyae]